ncbi:MAG TPA: PKD domain-containing protein [Bacteroidia bacterium]|nr:PKD domain-containing protein [Bacteroidia bacterium]
MVANCKHIACLTLILTCCCIFSSTGYGQALSGSYTIDKTSAATSRNFTSFQAFFNQLAANGISGNVLVSVVPLSGPYTEQVSAIAYTGMGSGKKVTIDGNGNTLSYTATLASAQYTLGIHGADYLTIKNLTVEALGTNYAWGIHLSNNSENITIENCQVSIPNSTSVTSTNAVGIIACVDNSFPFISGKAASKLVVTGCTVTGSASGGPYYGIFLNPQVSADSTADITISNNTILDFRSVGIFLTNCETAQVNENSISRPNITSVAASTFGIRLVNSNKNIVVNGNRIFNCFKTSSTAFSDFYGIDVRNALGIIRVSNNIIYENNNLKEWYGIYFICSPDVRFIHNTVSNDNTSISTSADIYGFYHGHNSCTPSAGSEFKNNIISLDRAGAAKRYCVYQNGSSITINHNAYHVRPSTSSYIGWLGSTSVAGLKNWQSLSGLDVRSVEAYPRFIDISSGNLIPNEFMLDDGGVGVGLVSDIAGKGRNLATPDPGAYEFTINAGVSAIVTSSHACQGGRDSVKLVLKNASAMDISGFPVMYTVNGGPEIIETYNPVLKKGDSVIYTFKKPVEFVSSGNYKIEAAIGSKPNFGPYIITVGASPVGGSLAKGAGFKGIFNSGLITDPDIVATPDTLFYDIKNAPGFPNSLYGSTWQLLINAQVVNGGGLVSPSDIQVYAPSPGINASVAFIPPVSLTGKTVELSITPVSLTTGCPAPAFTRRVHIAPRPVAAFSGYNACQDIPISFVNTSAISSGTINYSWSFGDGNASGASNPVKAYSQSGTFQVKLVAASSYGYKDSMVKSITVYPLPVADFEYKNKCSGDSIPFTNTSVVPGGSPVYVWDFGDNKGKITGTNPVYKYGKVGVYFPELKVIDGNGCTATVSKPVTFAQKPKAGFSSTDGVCNRKKVDFTNNSLPLPPEQLGFVWYFGDGDSASQRNVEHTYSIPGQYKVKLVARNGFGCVDSFTKSITIKVGPVADFKPDRQCAGEPVELKNLSSAPAGDTASFAWEINDGTTYTTSFVSHVFKGVGRYTVKLTVVLNNGCSSAVTKTVPISERPLAGIISPGTACVGDSVIFKNNTVLSNLGTAVYIWNYQSGISTAFDLERVYTVPGTYNVKLTVQSGQGCEDTASSSVTVKDLPSSEFSVQSSQTGDGSMIFIPDVPNGKGDYYWSYGDGGHSYLKDLHTVQYNFQGVYKVSLTVKDGNCLSYSEKSIPVFPMSGNKSTASGGVGIYPNPASRWVTVSAGQNIIEAVEIVGVSAQVVKVISVGGSGTATLDLTGLSPGLYFIRVKGDGFVQSGRLVICEYCR